MSRSLLLASSVAVAIACGSDASDPGAAQTLAFLADGISVTTESPSAKISDGTLTIEGSSTSGGVTRTLKIVIEGYGQGPESAGYSFGGTFSPVVTYTETSEPGRRQWSAGPSVGSGTLVIQRAVAGTITGAFDAVLPPDEPSGAVTSKPIRNGAFSLKTTGQ